MNTAEGNKLIADFMELPKCKRCSEDCGHYQYGTVYFTPAQMPYHKSWDWLMPVIAKFKELKFPEEVGWVSYLNHSITDAYKIEDAYNAVVASIGWYNEGKI